MGPWVRDDDAANLGEPERECSHWLAQRGPASSGRGDASTSALGLHRGVDGVAVVNHETVWVVAGHACPELRFPRRSARSIAPGALRRNKGAPHAATTYGAVGF